jgi:hypothetical protein
LNSFRVEQSAPRLLFFRFAQSKIRFNSKIAKKHLLVVDLFFSQKADQAEQTGQCKNRSLKEARKHSNFFVELFGFPAIPPVENVKEAVGAQKRQINNDFSEKYSIS